MLQTVRHVRGQEPSVRVGQEVVDGVAFRDRTVVLDGVDRISHVGIVVKDNGDGTVTCIEGNTAPDKKGDQRNGGQVCLKVRAYKKKNGSKLRRSQAVTVVGFGKPVFKS